MHINVHTTEAIYKVMRKLLEEASLSTLQELMSSMNKHTERHRGVGKHFAEELFYLTRVVWAERGIWNVDRVVLAEKSTINQGENQ